jgi:hypothetical protein
MATNEEQLKEKMIVNMVDHTRPVRISYAKIFEKEKNDLSGNMEYSAMFLIPKDDSKTVQQVKDAINSAMTLKWGANVPNGVRIPLRDGDKSGPTGVPSGATAGDAPYGGHYFVNAKNTTDAGPALWDQKGQLSREFDKGKIVSGDYVLCALNTYAYDNKSKGVGFGLQGVQLVRKGDPLGNSFDGSKVFGEIPTAVDATEDALDSMLK